MIDLGAIAACAAIYTIGVLSPGPNFMVVAQRALLRGRTEALAATAGVVTVAALWASASLFGLAIVFRLFPWTYMLLKIAGAAYLVWFGIRLWRSAGRPIPDVAAVPLTRASLLGAYRAGLATNLSNAKAIAFYTSAFSATAPAPDQTATLWVALAVVLVISALWYGLVAAALSSGPLARAYRRGRGWIERLCGVVMVAFGARLALSR